MKWRVAILSALAMAAVAGLVLVAAVNGGVAQTGSQRISFVMATGSTAGTYFPVGEAIAGIVSHPRGVDRCDRRDVCGPEGLIASTRTSEGTIANVFAVNARQADSALAQSDVVAEAIAGKGVFAKPGKQLHVMAIADLYPEEVHVVVGRRAKFNSIAELRGKRVSIGGRNSGTIVTARAVLAAYRLSEKTVKPSYTGADLAATQLEKGQIDAFFFVGGAPVPIIQDLIGRGVARLLPIDGAGRKRLLALAPSLSVRVISAGTYQNTPAVDTVSVHAIWIVNDSEPNDLIYSIVKSVFNPANRALLNNSHPSARFIRVDQAASGLPVPLHPGALRYYRETGNLARRT
ncbi:MAG: TAXI family TRAP transporter solute-binding subunit [Proteobacteria bacterium]|nr:TAXI family TRAP transporter solute-binding subunit [Pseudomonadota bacterium]